jgi:hypothetical protein
LTEINAHGGFLRLIFIVAAMSEGPMPKPNSGRTVFATHDDVQGILGNIDPEQMLAIMSLQPTIADIEEASVWLAGDADVFSAGEPIKGVASDIVTVLTENEDEEPARVG